jgi:hypothetical protein
MVGVKRILRYLIVAAAVWAPVLGTAAVAAHAASPSQLQEGDNKTDTTQSGTGASGDSVGGQVTGVVASGNTSVDATNNSDHVDASSGDARGENSAHTFTGLDSSSSTAIGTGDILNTGVLTNLQEGSNRKTLDQSASALSGDAVAGEVTGVVSASGGSADLVLANSSTNSDVDSGGSRFENNDSSVTGLVATGTIDL